MRRSLLLTVATFLLKSPVAAQTFVVDSDSIELQGNKTYRLYGIDAPDEGQVCPMAGQPPTRPRTISAN